MKKQSPSKPSEKEPSTAPAQNSLSGQAPPPHCRHRRLRRRAGSAGTVPAARAARVRHGLYHSPAPGPGPQGDPARTAPAHHRNGGLSGQGPDAGQAGLRLCDPPQQGHVHSPRGAAPVRADGAPRPAPSYRFLPPFPGRRPAGAQHRRHPFRHGLGRHHGAAGNQGERGSGAGAGACLGQVRQHAPQRHRCRAGRPGGPGGGAAGQDHRVSPARPRPHRDRAPPGGEGPERPGESPHPVAGQDRPRLLPVQEDHHVPTDRAAHGDSPDRPDRCVRPLSAGEFPGGGTPLQ